MAESKRTFRTPGINRDLDDRLLSDGMYRDGLNVNVGRSEGDDVGALENLKGNEIINPPDGISLQGETIGVVRDPNNDRIYWFNTGDSIDGIYEYDESTGAISPILLDQRNNPLAKPTCTPVWETPINDPASDGNTRPPLPDLPAPPVGGCTDRTAINFDAGAAFDDGSCIAAVRGCTNPAASNYNPNANVDDGSCTFATFGVDLTCPATGTTGTAITLTAAPSNAMGTVTYAWSGGSATGTTASISVTETTDGPVTYTVTATDSAGSATATCTVAWSTTVIPTYNFNWTPSGRIANVTISGGITNEEGVQNVAEPIGATVTLQPATGFQWEILPTIATAPALPAGVTGGNAIVGTVGSTNAASASIGGTWTPTADYSGTATISGGAVVPIPPSDPDFVFVRVTATAPGFTFVIRDINGIQPDVLSGAGTVSISGGTTTLFGFNVNYTGPASFPGSSEAATTRLYSFSISYTDLGYSSNVTQRTWQPSQSFSMTLPDFTVSSGGATYNVSGGTSSIF